MTYILRLASVAVTGEYSLKSKFVMFSDSLFHEKKIKKKRKSKLNFLSECLVLSTGLIS